jgi:uncharacterized protein (DUF433 family)
MPILVDNHTPAPRARIMGTGIEVWQVVQTYLEARCHWARLRQSYDWLSEADLRDALAFANEHRQEIAERIHENYACLPEELRPTFPICWD